MNIVFFFAAGFGALAGALVSWRVLRQWSESPHGRPRY
jgi:hypothetical protein